MSQPAPETPARPFAVINESLRIPAAEIRFTASRSGGPGGQHVNKVSTKATLSFNVAASPSLSEAQKALIGEKLGARIGQDGELRIDASEYRSLSANKAAAMTRFIELMRRALAPRVKRVKTRPSLGAKLRRLEAKKRRGAVKRLRADGRGNDE